MKKTFLGIALTLCTMTAVAQEPLSTYDLNKPFGWGAMEGFEVTGGAGGDEVVVTTEEEFDNAINAKGTSGARDLPRTIYIQGQIEFKTMHTYHVKNKTILGLPGSKIFSTDRTKKNSGI